MIGSISGQWYPRRKLTAKAIEAGRIGSAQMVNISSNLAIALGMKHEALFGEGAFDMPFRDEFKAGWFWFGETFEEPKRSRRVYEPTKWDLIRIWKGLG